MKNIKNKLINRITAVALITVLAACSDEPTGNFSGPWSIPQDQVVSVLGIDGIPALTNPDVISPAQATYLSESDLVIGYRYKDEARAYPHRILDWHEIVNDDINGDLVSITYCPLTGTAVGWERNVNGNIVEFGVSGMLYNTNLIPYDRNTSSAWSQMLLESVNGEFIGTEIETFPVVETTWRTWKKMYPNTLVLSTNTGHVRDYSQYPYINRQTGEDYRIDPFLLFPISVDDDRLRRKRRVLGVIVNNEAKTYRFSSFADGGVQALEDNFNGVPLIIAGSNDLNFLVAYQSALEDGTQLSFTPVQNQLPVILEDNEGNRWDIFGEAVSGPRTGQRLPKTDSYIGMWFAWGTFYPAPEIYDFGQ